MTENIILAAENYSSELDKVFVAKSATAFLADNALRTKFIGAKTVIMPEVNFDGLSNYDRKTGFSDGAVNVAHNSYTMTMDRARSLSIDREDMDEAGIASLAGKILGEYVRTKVVPECDAYVISKLAQAAEKRGNVISEAKMDEPFAAFNELVNRVQNIVGYDEEIVCFVDSVAYASLCASSEVSRMITVTDFKQGNIDLKVKSINGVAIIPVVSERMKNAYTFDENGFRHANEHKQVFMMVLPKTAAHLVKKTEKMRVFSPEQNSAADAYKFDYRIYSDVFVKESAADSIWVWESESFSFIEYPDEITASKESEEALISAFFDYRGDEEITYEWYLCDDKYGRGARKIENDGMYLCASEFEATGTY